MILDLISRDNLLIQLYVDDGRDKTVMEHKEIGEQREGKYEEKLETINRMRKKILCCKKISGTVQHYEGVKHPQNRGNDWRRTTNNNSNIAGRPLFLKKI